ncbi:MULTISPECIES: peptidase U32 family protein [unclassified Paenibacillus]|uniref:peptidase U32 family protein n=1 Tax=unclassified Paenibacillus TaxID=185978 RepID=UPI000954038A|nr:MULTISPECIES: peptidase U32 family protein [unclassified Paenibacillus]ASS66276.1 U32 family peptidase [Paenibacillus sp. RUD330]SIQ09387.1 putative protease [Paenibacillus sp. RU4X]SIQ29697.1 putative protease [Paenibacillus sp. RU4T]
MNTKPELLTTAASLGELRKLMEAGADAFIIGESKYGARLPGEFGLGEMAEAVEAAHGFARPVRIYAAVNNLLDNAAADSLPEYLGSLAQIGVDAIVFGDPSVLVTAREAAPGVALHWNAEMTSTSYAQADYWGRRGASRIVLARELNMEQIIEIKQRTSLEVQVQVHGMTNIYHSKRSLVDSYMGHLGKEASELDSRLGQGLYLMEEERRDERYPIYQDAHGTYMMSSDDVCMIENLHELMEAGIDSLRVEGLMKTAAYNETVIRAYRAAIDAYAADPQNYEFKEEWLDAIRELQDPSRELSYGFFFKEQVY